jgi:hypothetical protein
MSFTKPRLQNLTYATPTTAILRVDDTVGPQSSPDASTGRFSVRVESKAQYNKGDCPPFEWYRWHSEFQLTTLQRTLRLRYQTCAFWMQCMGGSMGHFEMGLAVLWRVGFAGRRKYSLRRQRHDSAHLEGVRHVGQAPPDRQGRPGRLLERHKSQRRLWCHRPTLFLWQGVQRTRWRRHGHGVAKRRHSDVAVPPRRRARRHLEQSPRPERLGHCGRRFPEHRV